MYFYHGRREEFKDFFSTEDGVVFCKNICSVMKVLKYDEFKWKLCGDINTLRTGSFKFFKRPFPGFLTILTL